MGRKILSLCFVILMVGVVVFSMVRAMSFPESERKIKKAEPTGIALEVRDGFASSVKDNLGETESSLGLAYLTGMKDGLDKNTVEMLRAVGLSHIVVASGTHLSIIVEFFRKRFGKISRFAGLLGGALAIFAFGQIVGWTASITRAAIVAGLTMLGSYYGRKLGAMRVILFAMAVTLLINPLYLFDLGWQLSFASFIGIMLLAPIMKEFFFGKEEKLGFVAELVLTSISAMLMCAPLLLYYFGSISIIAIVANVLILPTISIAMGLTLATGLAGFLPAFLLFDWVRFVITKLATLVLDYHLFIIEFLSKQTSLIITVPKNQPLFFLLYIPFLAPFVVFYFRKEFRRYKKKLQVRSDLEKFLPYSIQN